VSSDRGILVLRQPTLYVKPRSHETARCLSRCGAASQLPGRELRGRKRHDLSIKTYVNLRFTENPLVMDVIVCRNSAGVGCGGAPGNHDSGRDARFALGRATRLEPLSTPP